MGNFRDFTSSRLFHTMYNFPVIYGKFVVFYLLGRRQYFISDAKAIKEILLKRPKYFNRQIGDNFADKIIGTHSGLFSSNGEQWSRLRRALAPAFNDQNIKNRFSIISEQVIDWMQRLEKKQQQTVDMKAESFSFTIRVITVAAFALSSSDTALNAYFFSAEFLQSVHLFFKLIGAVRYFPWPRYFFPYHPRNIPLIQQSKQAATKFTTEVGKVIAYKRSKLLSPSSSTSIADKHPSPASSPSLPSSSSMIDNMLLGAATSSISDEEIISNVKLLYVAGAEANSVAITWTAYILARHAKTIQATIIQEVETKLGLHRHGDNYAAAIQSLTVEDVSSQHLPYCCAFVQEIFRYYTPTVLSLFSLADTMKPSSSNSTAGYTLDQCNEQGERVILQPNTPIWLNGEGVMKDATIFPDPFTFKPERWLLAQPEQLAAMEAAMFAFGSGPRICPGIYLARMEVILAVIFLAYYFEISFACPVEEIQRVIVFTATANKMPLKFSRRKIT